MKPCGQCGRSAAIKANGRDYEFVYFCPICGETMCEDCFSKTSENPSCRIQYLKDACEDEASHWAHSLEESGWHKGYKECLNYREFPHRQDVDWKYLEDKKVPTQTFCFEKHHGCMSQEVSYSSKRSEAMEQAKDDAEASSMSTSIEIA